MPVATAFILSLAPPPRPSLIFHGQDNFSPLGKNSLVRKMCIGISLIFAPSHANKGVVWQASEDDGRAWTRDLANSDRWFASGFATKWGDQNVDITTVLYSFCRFLVPLSSLSLSMSGIGTRERSCHLAACFQPTPG